MTDTAVENTETEQAVEEPKPTKTVKQSKPCFCQAFEVRGETDDEIFSTGCELSTMSTFGQGHDARLVSFLVDAHADGYSIWVNLDGKEQKLDTPAAAAGLASEALRNKAEKATQNRKDRDDAKKAKAAAREQAKLAKAAAKEKAKAEKEAAKAAAPKTTGAEVVSTSGDVPPLADGQTRIKVGRYEYVATVDDEGNATYLDGKGETQVVERDGYRVLTPAS